MRDAIRELLPGANLVSRPRLSHLSYAGEKKITRLPRRSAIVAFSVNDVYAIAELVRRQRGGAAVVLGALSPRTRNAQVELYQNGDVDFLVATDAIGMGLNLDLDHVAFAGIRKFDGHNHRNLTPAEIGQIAGRAGRHMNDGTFGVTGQVPPFEAELIERLENHNFDQVGVLQWRSRKLDFTSIDALKESLREMPDHRRLTRSRMVDDVIALENVTRDEAVLDAARGPAAVGLLWEMCQIPDYRRVSPANHAELAATLYRFVMSEEGKIPEDWFANQVAQSDRTDGDLDTLSNRLAQIRTWTFVSHRAQWLHDPEHWQDRTRAIEDTLSDALHERLTQRFVDRRTSVLMRRLRDKEEMMAEISSDGQILVENHYVGRLDGFRFTPDGASDGIDGKAARHAATQVLATELATRAAALAAAPDAAITLSPGGRIIWQASEIGKLERGETALKPRFQIFSDEHLAPADLERIETRLQGWLAAHLEERLKPLVALSEAPDLSGLSRGLAFRLTENLGVLRRDTASAEIKALDQTRAANCANTASASAPSISTSPPCSNRRRRSCCCCCGRCTTAKPTASTQTTSRRARNRASPRSPPTRPCPSPIGAPPASMWPHPRRAHRHAGAAVRSDPHACHLAADEERGERSHRRGGSRGRRRLPDGSRRARARRSPQQAGRRLRQPGARAIWRHRRRGLPGRAGAHVHGRLFGR
ncbi:helicase-related protein [Methyloceanibacter superfactus]|uniref:helicase-related protein n=1 Tax=Methyloceanibacter superfactus TaxID=1774969 RepID=UPI003CC7A441